MPGRRLLHAVTGGGRLGLRARITLAFALGSLLLSALMAGSTFGVAREQLIRQRESAAVRTFLTNAGNVSAQTRTNDPSDIVASGAVELPRVTGDVATGLLLPG